MGETEKGAQNSPQLEAGKASSPEAGSTPKPETPTLTETQAKVQVEEAVQKARIQAGRTAKDFEGREVSIKAREEAADARQTELDAIQKRLDDTELEGARDNTDALSIVQGKQQLRRDQVQLVKDRADLARDKATHQGEIEATHNTEREIAIFEIAQETGTDPMVLKELNLDLEETKKVAKAMVAGKSTGGQKPPIKPDPGTTAGGATPLTAREKIKKGFDEESK